MDIEQVQAAFNTMFPDPDIHQAVLELLRDHIQEAHQVSGNGWVVSLYEQLNNKNWPYLVFQIRNIYTLSYKTDLSGNTTNAIITFVDKDTFTDEERLVVEQAGCKVLDGFKTASFGKQIITPLADKEQFMKVLPIIKKNFPAYIRRVLRPGMQTPFKKLYQPEIVAYINQTLDSRIPHPAYYRPEQKVDVNPQIEPNIAMLQDVLHGDSIASEITVTWLTNSLASSGLYFTAWQVATFYTALQTKGFVILSGISGTGKTKLAQTFARLFPQPGTITVIPADILRIPVQPYMRKYNRIIISKSVVELFTPPEAGQAVSIKILFDGKEETCLLKHYQYSNTDYIQLLLRGKVRTWFLENFAEGSQMAMEIQLDDDGMLNGFRLGNPEDFAQAVITKTDGNPENYLFLSVRPDWRDSKSLLGFFNPLEQKYQSTPFLEFIKRACQSYGKNEGLAWFVLLDEMNLARVEYYFADLLSVLESGRDLHGWSREPIRLDYPSSLDIPISEREIYLPPNLYIIGTVNVDETTHAFSPKVLDRAFTLELTEADFSNYPMSALADNGQLTQAHSQALLESFTRQGRYAQVEKSTIYDYAMSHPNLNQRLQILNTNLQHYDLHFGYRVFDELISFLANAEENGLYKQLDSSSDPFDAAVLMKILPKFHGSRSKLEEPLKLILAWCLNSETPNLENIEQTIETGQSTVNSIIQELEKLPYRYPHTANRVLRMLRALYSTGFAAFG